MNSHYNIIIVAGGTGTRMQSTVPKQFIEIKGKPILIHTIEKFIEFDEFINVIVCVHKDYLTDANFMLYYFITIMLEKILLSLLVEKPVFIQ